MPTLKAKRIEFDSAVRNLIAEGKTEKEIAAALNCRIEAVADARRRTGKYLIHLKDEADMPTSIKINDRKPRAYKVICNDGIVRWDVGEFFGIWER